MLRHRSGGSLFLGLQLLSSRSRHLRHRPKRPPARTSTAPDDVACNSPSALPLRTKRTTTSPRGGARRTAAGSTAGEERRSKTDGHPRTGESHCFGSEFLQVFAGSPIFGISSAPKTHQVWHGFGRFCVGSPFFPFFVGSGWKKKAQLDRPTKPAWGV